jgi:hypothetical protein
MSLCREVACEVNEVKVVVLKSYADAFVLEDMWPNKRVRPSRSCTLMLRFLVRAAGGPLLLLPVLLPPLWGTGESLSVVLGRSECPRREDVWDARSRILAAEPGRLMSSEGREDESNEGR